WLFDVEGFDRGEFSNADALGRFVLREDWPQRGPDLPAGDGSVTEVLIRLTGSGSGLSVVCVVEGVEVAREDEVVVPVGLASSYHEFVVGLRPPASRGVTAEFAQLVGDRLARLGTELGAVVYPGGVGERVSGLVREAKAGDSIEVVIECSAGLAGLPFEAAMIDGVVVALHPVLDLSRRVASVATGEPVVLAGPLKVLVAVGAPDEGQTSAALLNVEREWAEILSALERALGLNRAEVTFLESTTASDIEAALTRDAYHVLHISGHGSPAGGGHVEPWIEMADEDGNAVEVTVSDLAGAVLSSDRPLPLVFLASCRTGVDSADATSLAVGLLEHGLPRVVAMQTAVTDDYSTDLASAFYERLSERSRPRVSDALSFARREAQARRAARARGENRPVLNEYATATLFSGVGSGPILDPGLEQRPLSQRPEPAAGGVVPEFGLGEVVGRRRIVRDTFRALIDDPKSLAAHGAIGGVVLTGMGGSGKTTVAGRVVSRLRERGWSVAGVRGRLSVTDLAVSIGQALPDLAARLEAAVEDTETVGLICEVVAGQRIVLVFDDFEVNLDPGTGGFREESTQVVMAALADAAEAGKLLITSRYPPEGLDDLLDYPVGPLTASETARL
ncbi:MAG: CHAT domain-containing protein, partial [bacterium]|nr:CHAT domain-containing protein [bacterium]